MVAAAVKSLRMPSGLSHGVRNAWSSGPCMQSVSTQLFIQSLLKQIQPVYDNQHETVL